MNRNFELVGASVGIVLFLAIGLLPSMLYGGYAGLLLASGISGSNEPTLFIRAMVLFGIILGVTAVASLFTIVGAIIGSVMSIVARHNSYRVAGHKY